MNTDADLDTLIRQKDHLNILRYIRVHKLREPELVIKHGKALLGGDDLGRARSTTGGDTLLVNMLTSLLTPAKLDSMVCCTLLEQICYAACDVHAASLAELCLDRLRTHGHIVTAESTRFRLLVARTLESAGDLTGAKIIYEELHKENPTNMLVLKRLYCLEKAVPNNHEATVAALNVCLAQDVSDVAAWYEMACLRKDVGDFVGACYCYEEVILGGGASSDTIHVEIAECYSTAADSSAANAATALQHVQCARKHMAQALELNPANRRAQFGLVVIANQYLELAGSSSASSSGSSSSSKNNKPFSPTELHQQHEIAIAKELVKYGAEQVVASYKKSKSMAGPVKALMKEYTDGL